MTQTGRTQLFPPGLHWTWASNLRLIGHRPTRSTYSDASYLRSLPALHRSDPLGETPPPRWKFLLQSVGGDIQLSADDTELNSRASRLELLAVVRGLEAIDRPARVTLLTGSRYISRGIRRQLSQWREDGWQWERFGEFVPIRDKDLWQRVDHALQFHQVECCDWQAGDRTNANSSAGSLFAAAISTLRRGILTPLTAIWPTTFTRAA